MSSSAIITTEEIALSTGSHADEMHILFSESFNSVISDSACSSTVCVEVQINQVKSKNVKVIHTSNLVVVGNWNQQEK